MAYYPYKKGDIIKFKNQDNDTLLLYINEIKKSEKTSVSFGSDCVPRIEGGFKGYIKKTNDSLDINISSFIAINEHNYYVEVIPGDFFFRLYYRAEFSEILTNLNKAEMYIPNIIVMEYYPNNYEYFYFFRKVKIEKNKGITEFYDKISDCLWVKIE